jgi:ADP-heptose:LPS heptosyltransferase
MRRLGIHHFGEELTDFAETAALASLMDLVISVDTSIAHLAGALALPLWLLIADPPEYRWMLEREDSPWYPTARLFRQRSRGDWTEVIARVSRALQEAIALRDPKAPVSPR